MDVSAYDIRKVGLKVYQNEYSNLQLYYGIRLFDANGKIMEEEFCHQGVWMDQDIEAGSQLWGVHGFIYNGAVITKMGLISAKVVTE